MSANRKKQKLPTVCLYCFFTLTEVSKTIILTLPHHPSWLPVRISQRSLCSRSPRNTNLFCQLGNNLLSARIFFQQVGLIISNHAQRLSHIDPTKTCVASYFSSKSTPNTHRLSLNPNGLRVHRPQHVRPKR